MLSSADGLAEEVRSRAEVLLRQRVTGIVGIEGGANNRVFRVSAGEATYAVKLYPASAGDQRDRLGSETSALNFMRRHGMRTVPELIAVDRAHRIGIFEWIEGEPITAARDRDVTAVLGLLSSVHALRTADSAGDLPAASEACLSGSEIIAQLDRRLARLRQVAGEVPALGRFLGDEVGPALVAAKARAERLYDQNGLAFGKPIDPTCRSLSPSDFGFHNARRLAHGALMFYDFEYFGWDDPVKPVSDFLLHPGMAMTDPQRRRFAAGAQELYGSEPTYCQRLQSLFPLFGVRWCLILLNEFLPERWARRLQAGITVDHATVVAGQLAKAQAMLEITRTSLVAFPYGETK